MLKEGKVLKRSVTPRKNPNGDGRLYFKLKAALQRDGEKKKIEISADVTAHDRAGAEAALNELIQGKWLVKTRNKQACCSIVETFS